jgi:hypothetical protein
VSGADAGYRIRRGDHEQDDTKQQQTATPDAAAALQGVNHN